MNTINGNCSPIFFVSDKPQVEPAGEVMIVELAGQRFAMTAYNLLVLMEVSRRALAKRDSAMAAVLPMPLHGEKVE